MSLSLSWVFIKMELYSEATENSALVNQAILVVELEPVLVAGFVFIYDLEVRFKNPVFTLFVRFLFHVFGRCFVEFH